MGVAVEAMSERVELFGPEGQRVGVVGLPAMPSGVGFVLLNSGWLHRVGPHRLYVDLARRLTAAGHVTVRFDLSGLGDSPVRRDNLPLVQSAVLEAREVMDGLAERHGVERFVLCGICSGASMAFRIACQDPRVAGAVMINPDSYDSEASTNIYIEERGQARFYWRQAALSPRRWLRVLTGRSSYRKILRSLSFQATKMLSGRKLITEAAERVTADITQLARRGARLLFVFSAGDAGLDHLELILGDGFADLEKALQIEKEVFQADHTFTLHSDRQELFERIERWAERPLDESQEPGRRRQPVSAG